MTPKERATRVVGALTRAADDLNASITRIELVLGRYAPTTRAIVAINDTHRLA